MEGLGVFSFARAGVLVGMPSGQQEASGILERVRSGSTQEEVAGQGSEPRTRLKARLLSLCAAVR